MKAYPKGWFTSLDYLKLEMHHYYLAKECVTTLTKEFGDLDRVADKIEEVVQDMREERE